MGIKLIRSDVEGRLMAITLPQVQHSLNMLITQLSLL